MTYKIGDKVRLTNPKIYAGRVGIIKEPDIGGVLNDHDWIVELENGHTVPVWENELVLV